MTGIERIAAERKRQIEVEGWTPGHDAGHDTGELVDAALSYASLLTMDNSGEWAMRNWPWEEGWFKPSDDPIRNLEKAGALLAAEIDRIQGEVS